MDRDADQCAVVVPFALSLCIELLQLLLHVGFFELTDLVLNTVGGVIGAGMSMGVRKVVGERRVKAEWWKTMIFYFSIIWIIIKRYLLLRK